MVDRKELLSRLYYDVGKQSTNFRLCCAYNKDGDIIWSKWRKYLDAQQDDDFINRVTNREILKNEIIFDLDEGGMDEYMALINRLKSDGIKFEAYSTDEGRARHIHSFWKGLAELKKNERENLRERIVSNYDCDPALKSDKHVIPLEHVTHYKTGKVKKIIEADSGMNDIKPYLEKVNEEKRKKTISLMGLKVDSYLDNVSKFGEIQPFFYDKNKMFWFWNASLFKWEDVDDIEIMNALEAQLGLFGQTVAPSIKAQYIEAFKRVGRKNSPKEAPKKWIQFKDRAFSLTSSKIHNVTHDYFFTNPIPWDIGDSDKTPIMDKLFEEWVGKKHIKTLKELLAYCCYTGYPIQLLFCLYGAGRNGKSCFLKIMDKFLGNDNVTSTSLDLLTGNNKSRFEAFKLYRKLVALMGETNFNTLSDTDLLKRLTGGDKVGFEKKGKDAFDAYSYAKVLIASNSLPGSNDTSEGFYRRWLIIDFPNEFPEGKDITETIPEEEYNNLARQITKILPELLDRGKFTNQGNIKERKDHYIFASNPLPIFLKRCCIKDDSVYVSYNELYTAYVRFLRENKKRKVRMKEFKGSLEDEGYWVEKTSKRKQNDDGDMEYKSGYWIDGLNLQSDWKKNVKENCDYMTKSPTHFSIWGSELGFQEKSHNFHKKSGKSDQNSQKSTIDLVFRTIMTRSIGNEGNTTITFDDIFTIVTKHNITENQLNQALEYLKMSGDIFEPRYGYYAAVQPVTKQKIEPEQKQEELIEA